MHTIARLLQPSLLPTRHHVLVGKSEIVYVSNQHIQKLSHLSQIKKMIPDTDLHKIIQGKGCFSFHNGMRHTEDDFIKLVSKINQVSLQHQLIFNIFNPSYGTLYDVTTVAMQKMNMTTEKIIEMSKLIPELTAFLQDLDPELELFHFAHSEAGIICDNALRALDPAHKDITKRMMNVVTIGSPRPVSTEYTKTAINIYSDEDYVIIPFVKIFEKTGNYQFKQIKSLAPKDQKHLNLIDHSFDGDSYMDIIKDYLSGDILT
jgi:hypothetical protein